MECPTQKINQNCSSLSTSNDLIFFLPRVDLLLAGNLQREKASIDMAWHVSDFVSIFYSTSFLFLQQLTGQCLSPQVTAVEKTEEVLSWASHQHASSFLGLTDD